MNPVGDEDSIVAGFVWALAAWTLLVHIAVATGGSFSRLLEFTPIAFIVAFVAWFACRSTGSRFCRCSTPAERRAAGTCNTTRQILWLLTAAAVLCTYRLGYFAFWLTALLFLLAGWLWLAYKKNFTDTTIMPRDRRIDAIGLVALCSACVFITLLLHQPDIDDSFYISVAADAHRHPDRAIWSTDTVHDNPNLPVFLPIYKTEAYEYLIALVAKLLHLSSIRAAHTALPIVFSIFVALAWAQLARTIDPKHWLAITAVTILISIFAGATKPGPANYAFTRLQQGKSVMVSAIVPILCVYAFRLATLGGWRNAVMLAAAQIAGVGLSSTSIVIGPLVACAVGFLCLPFSQRRSLLRFILIAAACIYPLSMALLMRNKMLAIAWLAHTPAQPATEVLTHVLGDRAQLWFFLAALVGAWAVVPRQSQALLLAPCILLLGVMINPLLTHLLQSKVLTPNTYWRSLWVLPWLVWSAVFICGLSALVGTIAGRRHLWLSRTISVGFGSVILAILLGRHPIWRHRNGTIVQFGVLAVDQPEYTIAKLLATKTPPGSAALAPEVVACWTAVQDQRPPLIFVRSFYTQSTLHAGGLEDVRVRNQLGEIAGKPTLRAGDVAALLTGIGRYHLGAIVLSKTAGDQATGALKKAGFRGETIGRYSIWIRSAAAGK